MLNLFKSSQSSKKIALISFIKNIFSKKIFKGFTLIELLIVISIVALIAFMTIIVFGQAKASARDGKRKAEIHTIETALQQYYVEFGRYPIEAAGASIEEQYENKSGAFYEEMSYSYLPTAPEDPLYGSRQTYVDPDGEPREYSYHYVTNADGSEYALYDGLESIGSCSKSYSVGGGEAISWGGVTVVIATSGGYQHACAALSNGTVKCWGGNSNGQLGDGTTDDKVTPVLVSGITNAVSVVAGGDHTCATLADGTVECWGWNGYGQLGDGTTVSNATPVLVSGITNALSVATGYYHACAALSNGTVECWGDNYYGQLGDGTTDNKTTPVLVSGITNALSVYAGGFHTCATLSDETVECWGWNSYGQLGDEITDDSSTPVAIIGL